MNVVLHIPDDLAASLGESGDVERQALEALAVESYRADRLTKAELRRMLGLRTRFEVDAFLKAHDVYEPIELDDVERQVQDLQRLGL
jgi:hypothetical protein